MLFPPSDIVRATKPPTPLRFGAQLGFPYRDEATVASFSNNVNLLWRPTPKYSFYATYQRIRAANGNVTGSALRGILASNTGTGDVLVTTSGTTVQGGTDGIFAQAAAGNVKTNGSANIGGTAATGITALATGTVDVLGTGTVTAGTTGVLAQSTGANAVNVIGTSTVLAGAGWHQCQLERRQCRGHSGLDGYRHGCQRHLGYDQRHRHDHGDHRWSGYRRHA